MARVKIILDGIELSESDYSVDNISTSDSISNKKSATQEVRFFKKAYQLIKERVIDNELGRLAFIPCEILSDCADCPKSILIGEIQGKSVEFCDNQCYCTAVVLEKNRLLDCLKGQIVGEGLKELAHPNVPMDRSLSGFEDVIARVLQIMLTIQFTVYLPVLTAILLFLTIVESIIQGIDSVFDRLRGLKILSVRPFGWLPDIIPSDDRDILPDISDLSGIISEMLDILKSLDRTYYYPSPYVRAILQNACDKCGERNSESYSFSSSVINENSSDYYNSVYFHAPSIRGNINKQLIGLIEANKPIKTAEDFLNEIITPFNAEWRVEGNVLILEPKDFFDNGEITDFSAYKTCYSFIEEDLPARAEITYADDAFDVAGNAEREKFDHLEEWNEDDNPMMRGKKEFRIPFARHMIENKKGLFESSSMKVVKMSQRTTTYPKLLLWENNEPKSTNIFDGNVLYSRFFSNENPKSTNFKGMRFQLDIDSFECGISGLKAGDKLLLSKGIGIVEEIEWNWSDRNVSIFGSL